MDWKIPFLAEARFSCFYHVQSGESRPGSPWHWTVPTAPALTLAVPVYSGPALSGVTVLYQSPQLGFPPGLGCILSQCGLRVPDPELAPAQATPHFGGLCTSVLEAAQVPISLQPAIWYPARSLVCCDPNWTNFFPFPPNPLLLPHWPRSWSHIQPAAQVQNWRSLLAPISPSGLSL